MNRAYNYRIVHEDVMKKFNLYQYNHFYYWIATSMAIAIAITLLLASTYYSLNQCYR